MLRLSRIALIFAILFAILIAGPALLSDQFGPYPLMKNGDILDIFTALILLPIYWLMFQLRRGNLPKQSEMVAFMVLAAAWASGQGMHLSANSIGHLLGELLESDVYVLTHFYDEVLSHLIWHLGLVGLSALLIYRQWKHPFHEDSRGLSQVIVGGIIYGLTYFVTIVEAGTALLGVPFAIFAVLFMLIGARKRLKDEPLVTFFLSAYLLALLLFSVWAIINGGRLPEFSEVGIIT